MARSLIYLTSCVFACAAVASAAIGDDPDQSRKAQQRFRPIDVFSLEFASDPQISPDGSQIAYVCNSMDVMEDVQKSSLWTINFDGTEHRPLTVGDATAGQPRWSPSGDRLAYFSSENGSAQIYVRWMDTVQTARLTQLTQSPGALAWSSDGQWLAFSMLVKESAEPFAKLPEKPDGAKWADPPKVIRKLTYWFDGAGYLEDGFRQVFVLPADGGTPRQLTFGPYHHGGRLAWTPDSQHLVFSANRQED